MIWSFLLYYFVFLLFTYFIREKKKKLKAKKDHARNEIEDEDDDMDSFTQDIIDELPDPDNLEFQNVEENVNEEENHSEEEKLGNRISDIEEENSEDLDKSLESESEILDNTVHGSKKRQLT